MGRFVAQRMVWSVFVLFGVATAVFIILHLSGDPTALMLPADARPEDAARLRHAFGFDRPLPVQYVDFLAGLLHGDLGTSLRFQQPALGLVLERVPMTLLLAVSGLTFSIVLALPIGIMSAARRGTWIDSLGMSVALLGQSVPVFWLGLMLIMVFAVGLHWLPALGSGGLDHLVLPTISLGLFSAAATARLLRAGLVEVLDQEYVRTARAKGLAEQRVLLGHAIRNALIPVVTMLGLQFGALLGGALVTETIFAWPGMGRLLIQAIYNRDYPLAQAAILWLALIFVAVNLLVDLLYGALDPRIRYAR
jgi:ABC-type dipeptide/oligopeptide/nickel transport system permease component